MTLTFTLLQEHRALAHRLKAEHASQLRAEHARLHEQRASGGGAELRGSSAEHDAARHAHTVDMPHDTPLEMRGHCGGGEAQRGSQRQARVALGFTQTRASIWAPLWSLLAGLANVGRSRSHQLMSV